MDELRELLISVFELEAFLAKLQFYHREKEIKCMKEAERGLNEGCLQVRLVLYVAGG